jgi:hypothetical protein
MSDTLNIRLNYMGGKKADDRMANDKLRTLKKALLYSYQAETAILEDGREFRCLINPDKLKNDYDNKIISIPFYDICLNKEFTGEPTSIAEEPIDMKVGDVFLWKETETYWLVYLSYKEESAYFRAEIRQCSSVITIGDKDYRAYVRGPVETKIKWNVKDVAWNSLNYSKVAYIKEDEETSSLARHDVVLVDGLPFEVQAVNKDTASDGIMIVYLAEDYQNSIEDELEEVEEPTVEIVSEITGSTEVYPFDMHTYNINLNGGTWSVGDSKKARIIEQTDSTVSIEFITGRSGQVDIIYTKDGENYILPITINSF